MLRSGTAARGKTQQRSEVTHFMVSGKEKTGKANRYMNSNVCCLEKNYI